MSNSQNTQSDSCTHYKKPIFKFSLEELQALRGSIIDCETKEQRAIYWLISAIIDVKIGMKFLNQPIDFALKALKSKD